MPYKNKEKEREWYRANAERRKAAWRYRNAQNPEKHRERVRAWRKANPEKRKAIELKLRTKFPEKYRAKNRAVHLKRKYGLTEADVSLMLEKQGGRCAICKKDTPGTKNGWSIDHCHSSGKVRAILCHQCKAMLGLSADKPDILRLAADYLESHGRKQ